MRLAIATLLLVHGLIHLMGFLRPWKLAELPQLGGRTLVPLSETAARAVGVLWLLATLLLVGAAVLQVLDRDWWWMPGAIGVLLSQALIVLQWADAKAGTVANVLLLLPLVVAFATARFHEANEAQVRVLLARAPLAAPSLLTADEVATLPEPVKRWLHASGAVGKPRARTVKLLQRGELRTSPEGRFRRAEATQYFTIDEPGFVWTVDLTMMGIPVVGRDTSVEGRGRMLIKAGGLLTVADGTGEKFDQGTLLRFLGEIIWFPSAAVAPYLHWESIDATKAMATISWRGTSAAALFEFDERGRFTRLSARRYFNGKTLEDWVIPITGWSTVRGIEMPTRGGAVWKLASGDFNYYRWEILDVEPDPEEAKQLKGVERQAPVAIAH